jgi:hypothetical protein
MAMSKMIKAEDIAVELTEAVKDYTEEVSKAIDKEVSSTATKMKREIKDNSPVDSGDYRDGWSRKTSRRDGETVVTIYNKDKPSLTHLLEFGHAKAGGEGRVPPSPKGGHIIPAYEKYVPKMERNIEKIIERGG